MIHSNSLTAYRTEQARLHSREMEILIWLNTHTGTYTDRKIQELMGYATRADVQPRISTLLAKGLVYDNGKTPCHITGKMVRAIRISQRGKDWLAGTLRENRYVIPSAGQCTLF